MDEKKKKQGLWTVNPRHPKIEAKIKRKPIPRRRKSTTASLYQDAVSAILGMESPHEADDEYESSGQSLYPNPHSDYGMGTTPSRKRKPLPAIHGRKSGDFGAAGDDEDEYVPPGATASSTRPRYNEMTSSESEED